MSLLYIGFFICLVGTILLNWLFFSELIRIEYEKFRIKWFEDGEPLGMFYTPPESSLFKGTLSRSKLLRKWVFVKPDWIERDASAAKFYKYFRLTGIIYYSQILLIIISFIVIFLKQS